MSKKELQFVRAYVKSGNAPQAALKLDIPSRPRRGNPTNYRAGPRWRLSSIACRRRCKKKTEFGVRELFEWSVFGGTFDIGLIFRDGTGDLLPLSEWDPRMRKLVQKLDVKTNVVKRGKTKTIETISYRVVFPSRSAMPDRVAMMLGAKKGGPVKRDRPTPLSVMQELMRGYESLKTDFSKQPESQRDCGEPKDQQQPPADKL